MKDADLKALAEKATVLPLPWQCDLVNTNYDDVDSLYLIVACNETPKLLARIAALRDALHDLLSRGIYEPVLIEDALAADDKAQE